MTSYSLFGEAFPRNLTPLVLRYVRALVVDCRVPVEHIPAATKFFIRKIRNRAGGRYPALRSA